MPTATLTWITDYQRWLSEKEKLNNAQMVVNHFKGSDWTKESLCALLGNMAHESSINPNMYEYGYAWGSNRGFGLVQWTPRSKYWDWAVARGLPPRDGDSQLARIDYEIENNIQWIPKERIDNMTFKEFRTNAKEWSVDDLTAAFTWGYERPNEAAGQKSMPERQAFANKCYTSLDWEGTGDDWDFDGDDSDGKLPTGSNIAVQQTQYQYEKEASINDMTYIQVKKGDTLSAIAKKYGVDMNGIKKVTYTEIANKNNLSVGDVLILPKPSVTVTTAVKPKTHTVKKGDTVSAIAVKYKTSIANIQKKNPKIKDIDKIKVGDVLNV